MNTTANKITVLRIVLIPVLMILLYSGHIYWALGAYIIACLSDFVDGYIARHYNQVTNFGKFIDPLADKVLVLTAMCYFVDIGMMPGWIVALVLLREFAVSGLRLVAAQQGIVIAAAMSGKVKTFATMVCLGFMIALQDNWLPFPEALKITCWVVILGTTLYSGVEYFIKNKNVFNPKA